MARILTDRRDRASVLIVALGILTILALMAASFTNLAAIERTSSRFYVDGTRAQFLAETGMNVAFTRLSDYLGGRTGDWEFKGEDFDNDDILDSGEDQNGDGNLNTVTADIEDAMRPSFFADATNDGEPDLVELQNGKWMGYSGVMPETYENGKDIYSLKILDSGSQIYINGGELDTSWTAPASWPSDYYEAADYNTVLADILNKLGDYIGCPTSRVGDVIVQERPTPTGYENVGELETTSLTEEDYDLLKGYVTVHAWEDPSTFKPKPYAASSSCTQEVGSPYYWIPDYADGSGWEWAWDGNQPRAPVNVNDATKPVLVALFEGMQGIEWDYCLDLFSYSPRGNTVERFTAVTRSEAEQLADDVISWRQSADGPFLNWDDWFYWVDEVQSVWPESGATIDERYRNFAYRSMLKTAFNPNDISSKYDVPDHQLYLMNDKLDLYRYSTELCFESPEPVFRVESMGLVIKDKNGVGEIVAMRAIEAQVRYYTIKRHSSQEDFVNASTSSDDFDPSSATSLIMSWPEPTYTTKWAVAPDPESGYLGPLPEGPLYATSGTKIMAAGLDDNLDADMGQWRTDTMLSYTRFTEYVEGVSVRNGSSHMPWGMFSEPRQKGIISFLDEGGSLTGTTGDVAIESGAIEFWYKNEFEYLRFEEASNGTETDGVCQLLMGAFPISDDGTNPAGMWHDCYIRVTGSAFRMKFENYNYDSLPTGYINEQGGGWETEPTWSYDDGTGGETSIMDVNLGYDTAADIQWVYNEWHHMVFQWRNGNDFEFFVDGRFYDSWTRNAQNTPANKSMAKTYRVGNMVTDWSGFGSSFVNRYIDGVIRNVALYSDTPFPTSGFSVSFYPDHNSASGYFTYTGEMTFDELAQGSDTTDIEILGVAWTVYHPNRQGLGADSNMDVTDFRDSVTGDYSADTPTVHVDFGITSGWSEDPSDAWADEEELGAVWWLKDHNGGTERHMTTGDTFYYNLHWDNKANTSGLSVINVAPFIDDFTVYYQIKGGQRFEVLSYEQTYGSD